MIAPRTVNSRFGTGIEAIRVPGYGVLVEVDADEEDRQSITQVSEAEPIGILDFLVNNGGSLEIYFSLPTGSSAPDGTWRLVIDSGEFHKQKKVLGSWVTVTSDDA